MKPYTTSWQPLSSFLWQKVDKGIRPIGVAEVLKRWAAIALVLEVQHEGIPEKLSHQYGVCLPSGAKMVHKAISQPISTSTHNIMPRNWTLLMPSIPSQEKPSLRAQSSWPLYYFHTSTPSILQQHPSLSHDQNHTLTMEEGVQQGDPLGTIFFCLGFHGILNPIFQKVDAPPNALLLLLFVDDIFVCGSPVAIAEITTQIQSVLPNANLKLGTERGKMVCFSPEAPRSNDLKNLGREGGSNHSSRVTHRAEHSNFQVASHPCSRIPTSITRPLFNNVLQPP